MDVLKGARAGAVIILVNSTIYNIHHNNVFLLLFFFFCFNQINTITILFNLIQKKIIKIITDIMKIKGERVIMM